MTGVCFLLETQALLAKQQQEALEEYLAKMREALATITASTVTLVGLLTAQAEMFAQLAEQIRKELPRDSA